MNRIDDLVNRHPVLVLLALWAAVALVAGLFGDV